MKLISPKAQIERFRALFHSYSEIFFLQSSMAGVLMAAITFINPNVGIAGIVSVAAAYAFARFIGMSRTFLNTGFYTYNALLVGLSIGYLFVLSPLSLFFIVTAGIFSYLLSVMLEHLFDFYLKLPALSLPFVIISSIAYLASYNYSNLYVVGGYSALNSTALILPYWLEGFFVSLGAILFSPNIYAGALLAIVIISVSRILFMLAVMGFYLGAILSGLLDGAMESAFLNINNFNFILISMSLGSIYLVSLPRSYIIAAIAVAISTVLLDAVQIFWSSQGIPVFTMPFIVVTLTFLYVLKLVNFPMVAHAIRKTPEDTLDDYLCNLNRFHGCPQRLTLPFSGSWTVWQGFNGKWTHQGQLQHAYDFVIERDGKTYQNEGHFIEDYYAFNKPVNSPCAGHIIKVINNLPDNIPGDVDTQNNWGNLVIIDTTHGWYAELSHFARDSIVVREGEWVEVGTKLGLCGNSGYSPQPHIHVQAQIAIHIGAPTLPFIFQGYLEKEQFIAMDLPDEGVTVEPLYAERSLEHKTTFILEQQFEYITYDESDTQTKLKLKICMDSNGETYFGSENGKLFFNKNKHSFYFYRLEGNDPWLSLIFSALPRLPLLYRAKMSWKDQLPVAAAVSDWHRHFINLARAINYRVGRLEYHASWQSEDVVQGYLNINNKTSDERKLEVRLHSQLGFEFIRLGKRRMELQEII